MSMCIPLLATITSLLLSGVANGKIAYAGINLYGLANDLSIFGTAYSAFESSNCAPSFAAYPFYDNASDFYTWRDLGFNLFRLPLGWQHAQESLGGPLNETTMSHLDGLIDVITSKGSMAILDIHNYARWDCAVINQPDWSLPQPSVNVTNDDFTDLWRKLAQRYQNNTRVVYQLMNEPHDLNMTEWAETNRLAVEAIWSVDRNHTILLSGTQFARLTDWSSFSMPALSRVYQSLGGADANLVYDFHQYFDDLAGAYSICEPWSAFLPAFAQVTNYLRGSGAKGILTEFGGGPFPECVELFNGLLGFLEENSDVWMGWTAWGSTGGLELSTDTSSVYNTLTKVLEAYAPL